jgi:hypothetical protein
MKVFFSRSRHKPSSHADTLKTFRPSRPETVEWSLSRRQVPLGYRRPAVKVYGGKDLPYWLEESFVVLLRPDRTRSDSFDTFLVEDRKEVCSPIGQSDAAAVFRNFG